MAPIRNACVIYHSHPDNFMVPGVTTKHVDSRTIDLDQVSLGNGFLVKTLVLSSDPYLRGRMRDAAIKGYVIPFTLGEPIENFGVAVVIRSNDPDYQIGDHIWGIFSFEEYVVCHADKGIIPYIKMNKPPSLPWSLYVGVLGMPGQSAYMGWKEFAEEKARTATTIFVSGAAGPVGSLVIQLAKSTNPNLKVIASAGTVEKVEFLKSVGADVAFNYNHQSTESVLMAEKPIEIYWDNVAGPALDATLPRMENSGVIVACGAISSYNGDIHSIRNFHEVFGKSLRIYGYTWAAIQSKYFNQFYSEILPLITEGKIKYRECRYEGMEQAERALLDVHTGRNNGKAVIIVAED